MNHLSIILALLLGTLYTPKQASDFFKNDQFDSAAIAYRYILDTKQYPNDTVRCDYLVALVSVMAVDDPGSSYLPTAQEAAQLCHRLGLWSTEAEMLSHIAAYRSEHGDMDGAIAMVRKAVEVAKKDTSFHGTVCRVNMGKRLATLYTRAERNAEGIATDMELLRVLEAERKAHTDFVDFCEGQVFSQLALLYAQDGKEEQARHWLSRAEQAVWSKEHPLQSAMMLSAVYARMGMKEEFYAAASVIDSAYIPREYNSNFIRRIKYAETLADVMARREMQTENLKKRARHRAGIGHGDCGAPHAGRGALPPATAQGERTLHRHHRQPEGGQPSRRRKGWGRRRLAAPLGGVCQHHPGDGARSPLP
ncbi:MAG: hypothetical protein Q4B68_00870 [Bacteroidales bacterium]|nr:hypothetical protein [Bacteroidales bacterium]